MYAYVFDNARRVLYVLHFHHVFFACSNDYVMMLRVWENIMETYKRNVVCNDAERGYYEDI